jgi:putative redox protein
MPPPMHITLTRESGAQYRGTSGATGRSVLIAGPPDIGPSDDGVRPMEALLMSLASCSVVDVQLILQKGRHTIDHLEVIVDGRRADAVPAVFTHISLHFVASGDFPLSKLERAVSLSMEKYCSVSHMLRPTVTITATCALRGASEPA